MICICDPRQVLLLALTVVSKPHQSTSCSLMSLKVLVLSFFVEKLSKKYMSSNRDYVSDFALYGELTYTIGNCPYAFSLSLIKNTL
jgi:hypothetical protein